MLKILFDTVIVSHWFAHTVEYDPALLAFFGEVDRQSPVYFISTITVQEFAVYGHKINRWHEIELWLNQRFTIRIFDLECAKRGAELQALGDPSPKRLNQTKNEAKAEWHHDCGIMGTAIAYGMDMIVTAEVGKWEKYRNRLSAAGCNLRILEKQFPPALSEDAEQSLALLTSMKNSTDVGKDN
jgi:hypothetical protein